MHFMHHHKSSLFLFNFSFLQENWKHTYSLELGKEPLTYFANISLRSSITTNLINVALLLCSPPAAGGPTTDFYQQIFTSKGSNELGSE